MKNKIESEEVNEVESEAKGLAKASYSMAAIKATANVWKDVKTDYLKPVTKQVYNESVNLCRFFYRTEPVVSTVINKLVEIGINDIIISKKGLSENEFRVFQALKPRLLEFSETMAQELLLSGLVVPEIGYGPIDKEEIAELGVKKYSRLIFPISMWVRDPNSIFINSSMMSDSPSYFVEVPDDVITFIKSKGQYSDGTEDKDLYAELKTYYPDFVKRVMAGEKKFLLPNKLIIRRKYLNDNPYPIPYVASALDALQHKRRMRRMDYSIMDKVISAIMHINVGSDEFPVTSDDTEMFDSIRSQLSLRFQSDQNLERIFQLITNHTVKINWIFPDTSTLLDDKKYDGINEEILFALGFPRVLITGETARTGTSNPEIAILSPIKTMDFIRRKLLKVIKDICRVVAEENNFKVPTVTFKALNLHSFAEFVTALNKLYDMSGVSRTAVGEYLGYDFLDEADKLEAEKTLIDSKGLSAFGQSPFSANTANNNPAAPADVTTKNTPANTPDTTPVADTTTKPVKNIQKSG